MGFEYYAGFGPVASPVPLAAQEHYLYEVVNVLAIPHVEVNAGIGYGFTEAGNAAVAKFIVGYSWERERRPAAGQALIRPRGRR